MKAAPTTIDLAELATVHGAGLIRPDPEDEGPPPPFGRGIDPNRGMPYYMGSDQYHGGYDRGFVRRPAAPFMDPGGEQGYPGPRGRFYQGDDDY